MSCLFFLFPSSRCVTVSRCPGIWFRHLHCGPRLRFDSKRGAPCGPCPPRPQAASIPAPAFSIARLLALPPCRPCQPLTRLHVRRYQRTQVPAYPRTQVPRPGLGPFAPSSASTQLMCVYFLIAALFLFISSCLTTDIIINPLCCKVQWQSGCSRRYAGRGPAHDRQSCPPPPPGGHARNVLEVPRSTDRRDGMFHWLRQPVLDTGCACANLPAYATIPTVQPASPSALSCLPACSSLGLELGVQLTEVQLGGLELKPKRHRRRYPHVAGTLSPARVCLAAGRFVWYPAHGRSTCTPGPSSRGPEDQGTAAGGWW